MAALILVIGTLGTIALIDGANATTSSTKAREQGVNLQREIVEAARSVPYSQLTPTRRLPHPGGTPASRTRTLVAGLDDQAPWRDLQRLVRRLLGRRLEGRHATHDSATFCATGAGTTTRKPVS